MLAILRSPRSANVTRGALRFHSCSINRRADAVKRIPGNSPVSNSLAGSSRDTIGFSGKHSTASAWSKQSTTRSVGTISQPTQQTVQTPTDVGQPLPDTSIHEFTTRTRHLPGEIHPSFTPEDVTLLLPNSVPAREVLSSTDTSFHRLGKPSVLRKYHEYSSTKEYFESYSWLQSIKDLNFTFIPSEGQHSFDHVIVRHDEIPDEMLLTTFHLRDSCPCNECKHPITKQRLVNTFELAETQQPRSIRVESEALVIDWNDGHESRYNREWFQAKLHPLRAGYIWPRRYRQWHDPRGSSEPPSVLYKSVMQTKDGLQQYLNLIGEFGFCFVDDCPIDPVATKDLLERISFIRLTHYGGFYDFTSDLSLKDTAYTNIALDPHTDNTYFNDAAGLQMLHLLSHTDGQGGLSTLVDGYKVADTLAESDPEAFKTLHNTTLDAHASGNADIGSISPTNNSPAVINLVPDSGGDARNLYTRICWNNSDRAEFPHVSDPEEVMSWYKAAKKFNNLVNSDECLWTFQLQPGRPLIFDNWRMMHGRTAFTGKRRVAGGYINMDDYVAKWKQLNLHPQQILNSI